MKQRYDIQPSSVPAIIDEISTVPHREEPRHDETYSSDGSQVIFGVIHFIAGIIILVFLFIFQDSGLLALAGMIAYLVVAFFFTMFIGSGTMLGWIREWYWFRLEKYRIDTKAGLAERYFDVLEWQEHSRLPLPIPQTPYMEPKQNYVSPYSPQAIIEAEQWARSLFGSDGHLDSRKVHANGKIKVSVVGSRRAGGSQDAQQYLIDQGFLKLREGGFWVDYRAYPTAVELSRLSAG